MSNKAKKRSTSHSLWNSWREQWRYAWVNTWADIRLRPLSTLLTVTVIAISLTLPSVCYILWKNVNHAAEQWYPTPQLTAYLDKSLDDKRTKNVVATLQSEAGVESVNYLSQQETLEEFRSGSNFGKALDMLEENPLPAVAIITPTLSFQRPETLKGLQARVARVQGVADVRMDDSWFTRLLALTGLIGQVTAMMGVLMVISVFLVIGNSVRLGIFSRRDTINVMRLIGANDSFIMLPFLSGGVTLGLGGAGLSLILSEILVWKLRSAVAQVVAVFGTTFTLHGLCLEEWLLLMLLSVMMGWIAAWLATVQCLRQFTPR